MISIFSMPTCRRLSATNCEARSTSPRCSGSVLMLGMRRNCFNSSRKRSWLDCTNASVVADILLPSEEPLSNESVGAAAERIHQNSPHFRGVKRLSQKIEHAAAHGIDPQSGIGEAGGDDHFRGRRDLLCEIQHIGPGAVGKFDIGKDYLVTLHAQLVARMSQVCDMFEFHRQRAQDLREAVRILRVRGYK